MRRFSHFALGATLFLTACGGLGKGQQPSWRKSKAPVESGDSSSSSPQTFVELGASETEVQHYNDGASLAIEMTPLTEGILGSVSRASASAGLPEPAPDGRLFRALDELAEVAPIDVPPGYALTEFALQRNGIIEPSPHLIIIWGSIDHPDEVVAQLDGRLTEILQSGRYARVGIGAARRGEAGDLILLAFQESYLRTEPIPRQLPDGGATGIEARLDPSFSEPHIFHTTNEGKVVNLPVVRFGATGIRTRFECSSHRGKQQIEITASDESGSTVLANFPIWCAEDVPSSLRVSLSTDDDAPPASREAAEARMLELVNEDRAKHGLPPLELDPRLVPIARAHSDEMLATGEVVHLSKTTGSASDRVKAGGVKTAVVLENVARAYGVGEAQRGLMNSPGHRANVLSEEATHMGMGITMGQEVSGRRELLVTQLFIRVPRAIDKASIRARASQIIQRSKAMQSSLTLDGIAQAFADEIALGVPTKEASRRAGVKLDQTRGEFRRVSTLVATVADIDAFDPKGSLGNDAVRFYGVGISQGTHDVMGEGAIFIVVLLGER